MGRQNNDPAIVRSSIALLQERFRQLERVKEMREEREILKMIKESERFTTPKVQYYDPTKLFFHPEYLLLPYKPPPQVSLSLWPNSQTNHDKSCRVAEAPLLMNLWPTDRTPSVHASSMNFDDYDHCGVDTSLHL